MAEPSSSSTIGQRTAAWAVHAYTATGVLAAFAAVLAVFGRNFRGAFLWLVVATLVDASDGILARLARVSQVLPNFDGGRLDDIVDYLTYVFVPALLIYQAGRLPDGWGLAVVALVLLSSGYGFASADAKSDDYFFTGFPSYWNIVAVYLFAGRLPVEINAAVLIVLSALVFVRIGYIYPSRTPVLRGLTIVLGLLWAAVMLTIIISLPDVSPTLLIVSLFFPVYYFVLSVVLHNRRRA